MDETGTVGRPTDNLKSPVLRSIDPSLSFAVTEHWLNERFGDSCKVTGQARLVHFISAMHASALKESLEGAIQADAEAAAPIWEFPKIEGPNIVNIVP